jgi:hypothetical protein
LLDHDLVHLVFKHIPSFVVCAEGAAGVEAVQGAV